MSAARKFTTVNFSRRNYLQQVTGIALVCFYSPLNERLTSVKRLLNAFRENRGWSPSRLAGARSTEPAFWLGSQKSFEAILQVEMAEMAEMPHGKKFY